MKRTPTVAELQTLYMELAGLTAVADLGAMAGISGSGDLGIKTAAVWQTVSDELGLDPASPPETGQIGQTLIRAWQGLTKGAAQIVRAAKGSIGLILTVGGLYIAHDWLTSDQQIAIAQLDAQGETIQGALKSLKPEDQAKLLDQYLRQTSPGITTNTVIVVGLGLAGAYLVYRWWERSR